MDIIALLAYVFSFGNVWVLALRLGVPTPIAPLIAPMVDLSVVGLLVALRYPSLHGVPPEQMKAATQLMHVSGLLTLALNIAEPVTAAHYGRAAVDAEAPLLLLGWGAVGPAPAFLSLGRHRSNRRDPACREGTGTRAGPGPERSDPRRACGQGPRAAADRGTLHRRVPPCRARRNDYSGSAQEATRHRPAHGHSPSHRSVEPRSPCRASGTTHLARPWARLAMPVGSSRAH